MRTGPMAGSARSSRRVRMDLILRWGLGVGLAIACVDALAFEVMRGLRDFDLRAAIELVDLLANLVLCGWAGYRAAAAAGQLRPGLEAAVIAGVLAGLAAAGYQALRGGEALAPADLVELLALNIVLAAAAGAMGAWTGSSLRKGVPPGPGQGPPR